MRYREDWRDHALGRIAYFLSVIASGHKLTKPYYPDALAAPYLDKTKPAPKTPEQRVREFQMQQRQRQIAEARSATTSGGNR